LAWTKVRGHDSVVEAFRRAVTRGRLAHAYLFVGPPGVGKRAFAMELAKSLLCEERPGQPGAAAVGFEACDRCAACIQVEAGTHPDLSAFARPPESQEFPVDLMRQLCHRFALKSARGRGQVVVVDDADDLSEEAANCFLKTLEEPPPRSVLTLIGSSPDRQLATVVSRCQVVRFHALPPGVVEEVLEAQGIADAAVRSRLAAAAGGSPGRALQLSDPSWWEFRGQLLNRVASPTFRSAELARFILDFIEGVGKDPATQRRRARLILRLLIDFVEDSLRLRIGGSTCTATLDDLPAVQNFSARVESGTLLAVLDRFLEGERQLERNLQVALVFEASLDALGQQLGS
jgi:DNA polymerase-3 subunit delta'